MKKYTKKLFLSHDVTYFHCSITIAKDCIGLLLYKVKTIVYSL